MKPDSPGGQMVHVAVLMGGWSAERPVSLSSGEACAAALEGEGYRVTRVDVDRNLSSTLCDLRPDVAFNALHGPYGEDGTVQGILEYLDLPYTHSGVMASALALDKERAKTVARNEGVPVAEALVMDRREAAKVHAMEPPYVVKPVNEGSSFGVLIVDKGANQPPQELLSDDWIYSDTVMVERFICGRELTCGVMGDEVLGVTEIRAADGGWYDYNAKYAEGGSSHVLPAEILPNVYRKVQMLSLSAHRAIGCRGVSRSDFRLDDLAGGTGELVWLEVNTQPGMTPTSLLPELAEHAGYSFGQLMRWMVEDASCGR
jgi:D-alanine-D-alanine ligase